ncbi:MAG: hypothetical protein RIT30_755 [Bacteroidota bacterium]|jgi:hypothetical protein
MKTAMQELIEYLESRYFKYEISSILLKSKELLQKEKESIIDAHLNGQSDHHFSLESRMAEAEQHYKEKYNQNK